MKTLLKNIRIMYPNLAYPRDFDGNKMFCYSASFLLAKGDENYNLIHDAIKSVADEAWGNKANENLRNAKTNNRICIKDGVGDFEGQYILRSGTKKETPPRQPRRPLIMGRHPKVQIQDGEIESLIYGGCYVNAMVRPWAHEYAGSKQINCDLLAVQFVGHGEAFTTSAVASADEFPVVPDDDDAEVFF